MNEDQLKVISFNEYLYKYVLFIVAVYKFVQVVEYWEDMKLLSRNNFYI